MKQLNMVHDANLSCRLVKTLSLLEMNEILVQQPGVPTTSLFYEIIGQH